MKIVHLGHTDLASGAGKAAYRIHRGLCTLGLESRMLVADQRSQDAQVLGAVSLGDKLWRLWLAPYLESRPVQWLGGNQQQGARSSGWIGSHWGPQLRKMNPDLVQLHWICGGVLRIEALARLPFPLVWRLADMWAFAGTEHYVAPGDERYKRGYRRENRPVGEPGVDLNRWVWRRKRKAWRKIANLTIVTPSRWLASCAKESVLLGDRRIEVIPTGQNLQIFQPLPQAVARRALNLPPGKRIILFGGLKPTSTPRKGFHLLQQALLEAAGQAWSEDWVIAVFGSSQPPSPPNLGFPVYYLGEFKDEISLALVYSAADVFVAPSTMENLANTVIEALACGVPCLAFKIGGMPDAIDHQRNGYLAEPLEPKDLAAGLHWLLTHPQPQALRQQARQVAQERFDARRQAQQYQRLFEDILEQHPAKDT